MNGTPPTVGAVPTARPISSIGPPASTSDGHAPPTRGCMTVVARENRVFGSKNRVSFRDRPVPRDGYALFFTVCKDGHAPPTRPPLELGAVWRIDCECGVVLPASDAESGVIKRPGPARRASNGRKTSGCALDLSVTIGRKGQPEDDRQRSESDGPVCEREVVHWYLA